MCHLNRNIGVFEIFLITPNRRKKERYRQKASVWSTAHFLLFFPPQGRETSRMQFSLGTDSYLLKISVDESKTLKENPVNTPQCPPKECHRTLWIFANLLYYFTSKFSLWTWLFIIWICMKKQTLIGVFLKLAL